MILPTSISAFQSTFSLRSSVTQTLYMCSQHLHVVNTNYNAAIQKSNALAVPPTD